MTLPDKFSSPGVSGLMQGGPEQREHSSARVHPRAFPYAATPSDPFSIFAAMPFAPEFDDVFFVAITAAAKAVGGQAVRVDQLMHGDDAVLITERELRNCRVVVADLSTNEADVLYELGLAHALGKPTVQLCSTAYTDLPFMVRNRETLLYNPGQIHVLIDRLTMYLGQLLGVHEALASQRDSARQSPG